MTDISPAVAKLQSEWYPLPDLDRARDVYNRSPELKE